MDDTLKQLLDAEQRAQKIVDDAYKERDQLIAQARQEAQRAEERFEARIPEIHASFVDKAEERAQQAVAELERRFAERRTELERMAEERSESAVSGVLDVLLDPERI